MDTRIGCKRDARKALNGELEFVGSGAYRDVYADRSRKVIYKVDQAEVDSAETTSWANVTEADTYVALCHEDGAPLLAPSTLWVVTCTKEWMIPKDEHWVRGGDACEYEGCEKIGQIDPWGGHHVTYVKETITKPFHVVAMPYLPKSGRDLLSEGQRDHFAQCEVKVLDYARKHDIRDMHEMNWRIDHNGNPFITDYAGY